MATATPSFESLRREIASRQLAPVYLLHGEEGYYIDALVAEFLKVIPEEDKDFCERVLYAPESEPGYVMDVCLHLPRMAERQMVILKECQEVNATIINKLHSYVEHPTASTTLVICFRGAAAKGKDLIAAARKSAVIFESKRPWESQIPALIASYVKAKGLSIDAKAQQMLAEFVGTDLSRLYNEIDKLAYILPAAAMITPEAVERNVGVSKDYNIFELVDAIAAKNARKVFSIQRYIEANPKGTLAPIQALPSIFALFADLMIALYTPDKSDASLKAALNLKTTFSLRRIRAALQNYNAFQVIEIIDAIRTFDAQSKGNGSRQDVTLLFNDLLYHILTAPGKLPL